MCSCLLNFSRRLAFTLVAAVKFTCFSFKESHPSSFSVILLNVDLKIKSKERLSFVAVFFFLSKSPGGRAISRRNAQVLEMRNFNLAYMNRWTHVRMIFS